ncbi:MAG TPA: ABC transporter permease [Blastocatellia bacterium]|nr:ABC transporter permease [Blastocatellia bacterium]
MDSLISANISQRPLRTLISMSGVALGVILVLLFVGLARGMMGDAGQRQANVDAEIRVLPSNTYAFNANPLMLPQGYTDAFVHGINPTAEDPDLQPKPPIAGIAATSPIGEWLQTGTGSIGFEFIDGIDYASYTTTTRLNIVEGRGLSDGSTLDTAYEAIVDRFYAETNKDREGKPIKVGSKVTELGQDFTVVGIYEPSQLARVKIPLRTLQELMGGAENCTFINVKCQRPELVQKVVEDLKANYPSLSVVPTDQIPSLYSQSFGVVEVFLDVVIALAVVISTLVILLAMYTTIVERTREIGILKSLGASRAFIVGAIEREAALISTLGVVVGFGIATAAKFWIEANTRLKIQLGPRVLILAAVIGLLSGLAGALFPAFRAAALDPVEALSYE